MVLLEFQMSPRAEGDSVSAYVAQIIDLIDRSGVPYQLTPMGTILEGEWDEVFDVVKRATEAVLPFGSRVSLVLKADIRPGWTGELDGKVERLERALDSSQRDGPSVM